jgi:hypothetical protein
MYLIFRENQGKANIIPLSSHRRHLFHMAGNGTVIYLRQTENLKFFEISFLALAM